MEKKFKRGLCVSGGGAWGAFGAGTLARLDREYTIGAGISTGSLITPLALLGEWERLKDAYTSVNDNDIFDLKWYKPKPITKNGKPNVLAVILALILGHKTVATTQKLRDLIDKFVYSDDYQRLQLSDKEAMVGCQNLTEYPSTLHFFSSKNEHFTDFKDWMWIAANEPFFTSLVSKEWYDPTFGEKFVGQWADGGISELIPLDPIIEANCDEIDVIIHRPKTVHSVEKHKINNLLDSVDRVIGAMRYDIEFEYLIQKCQYAANEKGIKINLYFLPRALGPNSLVFDKKQMLAWWQEGYNTAFDENRMIVFIPKK